MVGASFNINMFCQGTLHVTHRLSHPLFFPSSSSHLQYILTWFKTRTFDSACCPPSSLWTLASSPPHIQPVPLSMFEALNARDLELTTSRASASLPPLPPFLIHTNRGVWRRRIDRFAEDPDNEPWMSRVLVYVADPDTETQGSSPVVIVGRINFHGGPDSKK